jgi:hypothetical protein
MLISWSFGYHDRLIKNALVQMVELLYSVHKTGVPVLCGVRSEIGTLHLNVKAFFLQINTTVTISYHKL